MLLVRAGPFAAWFEPMARMMPGRRAVRMVRAGYTDTQAPPVTIAGHAAHCAALREAPDTGPATVVGHSSGSRSW